MPDPTAPKTLPDPTAQNTAPGPAAPKTEPDPTWLTDFLDGARVDPAVFALRPDYRVVLLAVDGLEPGPGDAASEALLAAAEDTARRALADRPAEDLPHVAAWRRAYRAFGAKPQRTRNSLEALTRRAAGGLPRVNRLTDLYNAISVLHALPVGGEDLAAYAGPPRLVRATGAEPFDTVAAGAPVVEHPEVGEVVWADGAGVTCRRWNWRQCRRTALREDTTAALFVLDALDPMTTGELEAAAETLTSHLRLGGSAVTVARRLISREAAADGASDLATVSRGRAADGAEGLAAETHPRAGSGTPPPADRQARP